MKNRNQLAGSAAILALLQGLAAAPALAQTAPAQSAAPAPTGADSGLPGAGPAEQITVTGSRIKTTNATAENPLTVVTSAQIEHSSSQTIEDVLQRLPSIGTSGLYGATNNGGEGASCTDIRNFGINRTLVLVNGRRFVHSGILGDDCVDLNNIPLSLVDRIEVLKDGASTTYGADAVAGVINIILKKNFTGTVIKADGSIGTDSGDGRTGDLSVTTGTNFDKGNVTVNAEYENRAPVQQKNYDWSDPVVANNAVGSKPSYGSGIPPAGRIFADGNNTNPNFYNIASGDDIATGNGGFTGYNRSRDGYDYGSQQYLAGSLEKESFNSFGTYEFTPNITGYVEEYFTHKRTDTQLAAQPVTGALMPGVLPDAFVVPDGNPYLAQLYGPNSGAVDLYRRVAEFGDRDNIAVTNTFQFNGGFKGTFAEDWDYDVFFQYGLSDNTITSTNEVNFARLEQEVGFRQTTATPDQIANINANTNGSGFDATSFGVYDPTVCTSRPGCVLINPFGLNSISQAGINYARFTEQATSEFTLRTFGGTITNSNLFQLPYGPLGVSLGVEHRRESGEYSPDALVGTGDTLENAQTPTKGAFDVTELYGELLIPIVKDLPGVKDLHVDLGGRFFDYNTFGTGETWKISANWTIIPDIRFRATDGVAFRQPSVDEAFGGQTLGFPGATDPCANASSYGAKAAAVIAQCSKVIGNYNPNTFTQTGNQQVQTISGGNPNLTPETARTQTVGVVLSPRYLPRSSITVDYYRTKIDNAIGTIQTQDILDGCYTGSAPGFCSQSFGALNRVAGGQLGTVTATLANLGETRESGLDIGATYSYPIPGYGTLSFQNDAAIVFKYDSQNLPDGPFIQFNGKIISAEYGFGYPRLRDNASLDWRLGDFQFGYQMRYISGMSYYPALDPATSIHTKAEEIFYHDINFNYDYHNASVNIGVNNLLDKRPPFVFDTSTNTDPQVYDVLGRVVYVKTTFRF